MQGGVETVEIGASMCASECDSAHYEGITIVCVCVCSFYGCSLRLINIDSELSLLAGSQVDSMEQIGHTSKKKKYMYAHMYIQTLHPPLSYSHILYSTIIRVSP